MPNHVVNEVVFAGITAAQRDVILANVLNAEGKIDFQIMLPIPINAWMGNTGKRHEEAFKLTALDWCRENWGTKWNAYSQLPIEPSDNSLRLVFETAWRPPYGWLCALFNRFMLPFAHNWHDEGRELGVVGRFDPAFLDDPRGESWSEKGADGDMQRHLYGLQWGVETPEELDAKYTCGTEAP